MSPEAEAALMGQIVPRLRSAIPRTVAPVGCEDAEELVQDGIAIAARMLHNSEVKGKMAPAASVAYYTIQHLRSGRRSTGNSCADALASGTQITGRSVVHSTEEQVGWDPELDEPVHLGELLACKGEDPSTAGARNLDWSEFLEARDYRYSAVVKSMAEGKKPSDTAKAMQISYAQLQWLLLNLEAEIMEHMGEEVLEDAMKIPSWRGNLRVKSERVACRPR